MALRLASAPTLSATSLRVGEQLIVRVKVENKGAEPAQVSLRAEGEPASALLVFEPASLEIPARSRRMVEFRALARLPDDVPSKTLRGTLVLVAQGIELPVGDAPLDVYVTRA